MDNARLVRRSVIVRGRVQGVFFRASVRDAATRGGVGGWVRNRADGSLEVHAEGSAHAVNEIIEFCRVGPRHAVVTDVSIADEEPVGETHFVVR